jgi:hypothetical protein
MPLGEALLTAEDCAATLAGERLLRLLALRAGRAGGVLVVHDEAEEVR